MIYLHHLIEATHGALVYTGKQTHFETFNQDTRQVLPGELFVAVRGEHGDGHDYLRDAVQRGAAGLLVEARALTALVDEERTALERAGVAVVAVSDTRLALQQYARFILQQWHPTVIAVTGSVGKTSTKEAIADVLSGSFATFRSWKNYNDLLGIPLSLGRLEPRRVCVGAAKRLHLEQLPGYAPDLNPDEGIWNYLKRVELGNVCCSDLDQLQCELIRARERLRHKKEIIQSCSRQCGYLVSSISAKSVVS